MMGNAIEEQIVRLLEEIAEDEKEIRECRSSEATSLSDNFARGYAKEAVVYEQSLQRKMAILRLLTR